MIMFLYNEEPHFLDDLEESFQRSTSVDFSDDTDCVYGHIMCTAQM